MVLYQEEKTQNETVTWSASGSPQVDISNEGLITELELTAEVTPSATLAGANQPDGLLRVGRNFEITGSDGVYFQLPNEAGGHGSTILHYLNLLDYNRVGHPGGGVTAPQRSYTAMTWWLHCGGRPWQAHDLSAFLPGLNSNSLKLVWHTTANSVMDDSVTISSATLRVSRAYTIGTERDVRQAMNDQQVFLPQIDANGRPLSGITGMVPSWRGNYTAVTTTYASYGLERNLTNSMFLRRLTVASQDETATRPVLASDIATGMQIKYRERDVVELYGDGLMNRWPAGSFLTANSGGANSVDADTSVDFDGHAPRGIMSYDFRNAFHPIYGLNNVGLSGGQSKVGLTITAQTSGDDVFYLEESSTPYYQAVGSPG